MTDYPEAESSPMKHALCACIAALAISLAAPAMAASTAYTLTQSWQKVAAAGQTVDVQNVSSTPAIITTSPGSPIASGGQILLSADHRLYALMSDLYAIGSGVIQVTDSVASASTDPNNVGYSSWQPITPGTAFIAPRGISADCTSAGTTTLTDGSGHTMLWSVGVGHQQQPYQPVNLTAVIGCTFSRLN